MLPLPSMALLLNWIYYGATEEVWFESSNRHSSLESVFLGGGLCVTLMPCGLCEYSLIMSQMDTWKNSMPAHKRVTLWCFPGRKSHSSLLQVELKKPQRYIVWGNLVTNPDLDFCSGSNSHLLFLGKMKTMYCPSKAVVTITLADPEVIRACVSKVFSDLNWRRKEAWHGSKLTND